MSLPGITPPFIPEGSTHSYHMYRIKFDPQKAGLDVHPGRFTKAIELAMGAEGLPLRLYQNIPIPGQILFKIKEGIGNGIPWTLPDTRKIDYTIEDYPVTLNVLETTRCIGRSGTSGPNYFLNRQTIELYLQGFQKLWDHLPQLANSAKEIDYQVPWSNFAPSTRGVWTIFTPNSSNK